MHDHDMMTISNKNIIAHVKKRREVTSIACCNTLFSDDNY